MTDGGRYVRRCTIRVGPESVGTYIGFGKFRTARNSFGKTYGSGLQFKLPS